MTVNANGVRNYGTTAAGGDLTLTTGNLVNASGLIFSGKNMSLRVADFNNSNANVYSLGNLTVDRDGRGGLANSIMNRSSTLQSDGSMTLAASSIQNVRDVLTVNDAGIYTARIGEVTCIEGVNAGDCSGKQNHAWEIVQREKMEVTAASAASSITAGGDLTLNGGDLLNQSSSIATAGNLSATLGNLTNSGVETGETETTRIYMSERTSNAGGWYSAASAFTNQYWYESAGYDRNNLGGLQGAMARFIGMTERELPNLGSSRKIASSDQSYAAVIQAAGAVNINARNNIDNSVVRPGYTYVGSGPRTGTGAAAVRSPRASPSISNCRLTSLNSRSTRWSCPASHCRPARTACFASAARAAAHRQSPARRAGPWAVPASARPSVSKRCPAFRPGTFNWPTMRRLRSAALT